MTSPNVHHVSDRRPSLMMSTRQRLYPYRRFLKWLRHVARWQMRFPLPRQLNWRFARWVSLLTTDPEEEVLWRMPDTSVRFALDLKETIQANLYYRNGFQQEIVYWIKCCLTPDRLFIDAGANVGIASLLAADYYRRCLGTAVQPMVYAFEPNPRIYRKLQRNISLNALDAFVSAHMLAVSERDQLTKLYLSPEDNSTSSSLAFLGHHHFHTGEAVETSTIALTSFMHSRTGQPRVGLLKLDIEGAELLALRGAGELLSRDWPTIISEVYPDVMKAFGYTFRDMSEFLRSLDYNIYLIEANAGLTALDNSTWPHYLIHGDVICFAPHSQQYRNKPI